MDESKGSCVAVREGGSRPNRVETRVQGAPPPTINRRSCVRTKTFLHHL